MTTRVMLAAGLLAATFSGCAAFKAESARAEVVQTRMAAHVYAAPLGEVWPEVEAHYGSRVAESEEHTLYTQWTTGQGGSGRSMSRLRVRGTEGQGGTAVVVTNQGQLRGDSVVSDQGRNHHEELAILRALDPERAAEIDAEAEQAATDATAEPAAKD